MARGNKVGITAQLDDQVSGRLSKIRDEFDRLGKSPGAQSVLQGVGLAAGVSAWGALDGAISTGIQFMGDSITKASDLNETIAKSEVIFGSHSAAVEDWAETMAAAGGQTKRAALDAASGFAGLFKTVGIGIDESSSMATDLTQLGSDLASFFNTDVTEALAALKSGLNGESEPLRRFNVFLSETAVTAKLAEMGVTKTGGAFTEAQKATARYALILDQTGDAQGDFARTGDGLANSQRTLAAEMDNLQAEIGQELLPVMRDLSIWARDEGVPALREVIQAGKDLGPVLSALSVVMDPKAGQKYAESLVHPALELHKFERAAADAADSLDTFDRRAIPAADAASEVGDAAAEARPRVKGLGGAAQKAADEFADLRLNADKAGKAVADAAYGPEHLRLEYAKAKSELKDNQREQDKLNDKIERLKSRGVPVPKALRDKFIDARIAVNESKTSVVDLTVELTALGDLDFKELEASFGRQQIRLDNLTGAAKEYVEYLSRAGSVSSGGSTHGGNRNDRGKASGGPVAAGGIYTVGENRAETLVMFPGGGGMVYPTAGGRSGGGGGGSPVALQINLDGRAIAQVVDRHLYYSQARAPQTLTSR